MPAHSFVRAPLTRRRGPPLRYVGRCSLIHIFLVWRLLAKRATNETVCCWFVRKPPARFCFINHWAECGLLLALCANLWVVCSAGGLHERGVPDGGGHPSRRQRRRLEVRTDDTSCPSLCCYAKRICHWLCSICRVAECFHILRGRISLAIYRE